MSALRATCVASIVLLSAIAAPAQTSYTIRSPDTTSVLTQGNATLNFAVPSEVTDVPLLLQGYDLSACHTSNVVPFTF